MAWNLARHEEQITGPSLPHAAQAVGKNKLMSFPAQCRAIAELKESVTIVSSV
jgi:hypothetical protein